jgi:hypothetical protein
VAKTIKGIFEAIRFIDRISITDLRPLRKKDLCYGSVDKTLHHNKIKRGQPAKVCIVYSEWL